MCKKTLFFASLLVLLSLGTAFAEQTEKMGNIFLYDYYNIRGSAEYFVPTEIATTSTFKLPDTGQTKCYQGVSPYSEIPCEGTGQDGEYNINPLSYTDNGDGTVTDNNTGLIWQKEDDGTPRTWDAAGSYCASLGTGWRLPTKMELMSIVDYSIPYPGPTINPIFTNTKQPYYWSSTTNANAPDSAWDVYFYSGYVGYDGKGDAEYVRCVHGGESAISSFTDNRNGTVTDTKTGLMWQQGEPGSMTWPDALNYCESLELPSGSGQSDWRLPNIKELESITDDAIYDPVNPIAIDRNFFPNAVATYYWSSTTYAAWTGGAWDVDFDYGRVGYYYAKYYVMYVRCARGGHVVPPYCESLIAEAGEDKTVNSGEVVTFDASGSSCLEKIVKFSWDFGDASTAEGQVVAHRFSKPGKYEVTLTIEDSLGNSATDTMTITVEYLKMTLNYSENDYFGVTHSASLTASYYWEIQNIYFVKNLNYESKEVIYSTISIFGSNRPISKKLCMFKGGLSFTSTTAKKEAWWEINKEVDGSFILTLRPFWLQKFTFGAPPIPQPNFGCVYDDFSP